VIDLPFAYYGTFVIEEKHGFNKEVLFLCDAGQLFESLSSFAFRLGPSSSLTG